MDEAHFKRRDEQFKAFCQDSLRIFQAKNRKYNDAIRRTGLLGACVEIVGASARLEPLILQNPNLDDLDVKAITNVLEDLHNYANIALIMLSESNYRGEKG